MPSINFAAAFPSWTCASIAATRRCAAFLDHELAGADLVLIHEWNAPQVVQEILARKARMGFRALFHDTHHRAYTNAAEILRFPLHLFDGVLAFGEAIRRIYADGFGVARVWTFHEAADVSVFHPLECAKQNDVLWIGNWGDEERTAELMEFLVEPGARLAEEQRRVLVTGCDIRRRRRRRCAERELNIAGYLPNLSAPEVYARSALALHVPRRQYANGLSGVPTIRVFEALACGVPLVCAPWDDAEGLFRAGEDYLVAGSARR